MSGMYSIWRYLLGIAVGSAWVLTANCALAQIVPDRTLPNNSSVTINGSTFNITGGTQAGRNLFHSFQQFSVPTGGTASFNNGLDIQNIISRVTGGSVSSIDGLIKANGSANLFFLNPSGIVFGRNASLNVGGSFVASTGNSLKFADGFEYSATATQTQPLLTISVPTGIQFGTNPGRIQVQGDGQGIRSTTQLIDTTSGLRVGANQTLALVGGDLSLEGATLKTAGGRIELGSVAGNSLVSLTPINKGFSLGYGGVQNFGNIQLSQRAAVDASGEGGGDVQVWGRNVILTQGSEIEASTLGSKPGGSLVVNGQDSVQLIGVSTDADKFPSGLFAQTYQGTIGVAPDLTINTRNLLLRDGGLIDTSAFGQGRGGTVNANVGNTLTISGTNSGIFADLSSGATGRSGDIKVQAGDIFVTNGGTIRSSTFGKGDSGNIFISARNGISLDASFIVSNGQSSNAQGNTGNIDITTGSLSVTHGAQINSFARGKGNAGNITIAAKGAVTFDGVSNGFYSGVFGGVTSGGVGNGGNINITAGSLSLTNGGNLSVGVNGATGTLVGGQGNSGTINLNVRDVLRISGSNSGIFASLGTGAIGRGGNINIQAGDIFVTNNGTINSGTFGNGNSGDITIKTRALTTRNSNISTTTQGNGDAGNLTIIASDFVDLSGDSYNPLTPASGSPGGLLAQVGFVGRGKGGNLYIETGRLSISDGSKVQVATFGDGNAGNLFIRADEINVFDTGKFHFFSTGIFGGVLIDQRVLEGLLPDSRRGKIPTSNAGDITINTRQLTISNGALLDIGSTGLGNAGNLKIRANFINLNQGELIANSTSGQGGNITLQVNNILLMQRNSLITNTSGTAQAGGNGGNFTLNTKFLVAPLLENNDIITNAFSGNGGKISILATEGIFGFVVRTREDLERLRPLDLDPRQIPTNDISAISQSSPTIITPDTDPSRGLVILPTVTENIPKLVSTSCAAFNETNGGSNFTITGRGGLPPSPNDPLTSEAIWTDTRLPVTTTQQHHHKTHAAKPKAQPIAIIPATDWVRNDKGEVTLISTATNTTTVNTPTSCPVR